MVAEVSKLNAFQIMRELPYAIGLQFRTAWYQSKGIKLADNVSQPTLKRVIE